MSAACAHETHVALLCIAALLSACLMGCKGRERPVAEDQLPTEQRFFGRRDFAGPPISRVTGVDGVVREAMDRWAVPGVSLAVAENGELVWAAAYGRREAGGEPLSVDTPFQVGSVSKPMAAATVLSLVEEGLVDLDAPLTEYLDPWPLLTEAGESMNLRRLLSHSSGLGLHGFAGYRRDEPAPDIEAVLTGREPANHGPVVSAGPAGEYAYSGGGYALIEHLVVQLTGRGLDAVARERVMLPAGLEESAYGGMPDGAAAAHRADGVALDGGPRSHPELAAAGLWSTAADLAVFALSLRLDEGEEEPRVLGARMREELLTPVVEVPSRPGRRMGLGVFLGGEEGAAYFFHSGANAGYRALWIGSIRGGRAAVVLTNGDRGDRLAKDVADAIAEAFDWPRPGEGWPW